MDTVTSQDEVNTALVSRGQIYNPVMEQYAVSHFEWFNLGRNSNNSLENALQLFGFPKILQQLDNSLEEVRRHIKFKDDHIDFSRMIVKDIKNQSLRYHPDKVISRGGSETEQLKGKCVQSTLNATKEVLSYLTKIFLENLDIDYKYKFYAKMDITLLANIDKMKSLNMEILNILIMLSEIKQEKIIARINKFLTASQFSLNSFIENRTHDFEKYRFDALVQFRLCIHGYEKLSAEFEEVKKDCKENEVLKDIYSLIDEMAIENIEQFKALKELEKLTKTFFKGKLQIFTHEKVDKYFVLPFVKYINILVICSYICNRKKNESKISKENKNSWVSKPIYYLKNLFSSPILGETMHDIEQLDECYKTAYYLASYFSNENKYKREVSNILQIKEEDISDREVLYKFNEIVKTIVEQLEKDFKLAAYIEGGTKKFIMEECKKWTKIMDDFIKEKNNHIQNNWTDINNFQADIKNDIQERFERDVEENKKLREDLRNFKQKLSNSMKSENE